MTAIRVDIPHGVAAPVWMAHVFRAAARALQDPLSNPPSLRLDPEPEGDRLIGPAPSRATEGI